MIVFVCIAFDYACEFHCLKSHRFEIENFKSNTQHSTPNYVYKYVSCEIPQTQKLNCILGIGSITARVMIKHPICASKDLVSNFKWKSVRQNGSLNTTERIAAKKMQFGVSDFHLILKQEVLFKLDLIWSEIFKHSLGKS